jgi:hypothetical protein
MLKALAKASKVLRLPAGGRRAAQMAFGTTEATMQRTSDACSVELCGRACNARDASDALVVGNVQPIRGSQTQIPEVEQI